MENKYLVDTKLGILNYVNVVNEIASGYFDDNDDYQPHMGLINAMTVFHNTCVSNTNVDAESAGVIDNPSDIEMIFNDDGFVELFNQAIIVESIRLDFANAFRDALDIVNTNKTSINHAIQKLKKLINGMTDSVSELMTPETIELVSKLKDLLESGDITVDKFIESYGDSKMFQQLLASKKKDKV